MINSILTASSFSQIVAALMTIAICFIAMLSGQSSSRESSGILIGVILIAIGAIAQQSIIISYRLANIQFLSELMNSISIFYRVLWMIGGAVIVRSVTHRTCGEECWSVFFGVILATTFLAFIMI